MIQAIQKYLLIGALALAALGSVYGLWQRSEVIKLRTHTQALENRVAGLESSERALRSSVATAEKARRAAQARANESQRRLREALQDNPDWARQPVPDGLWDALKP